MPGRFVRFAAAWRALRARYQSRAIGCPVIDFEVQKFTRRCAQTDRELKPGEVFYSVLMSDGADVVRRDFSADAWEGPSEDAIGWWKSAVPDPRVNRLQWAPHDVMLEFFEELQSNPDQQDVVYVLALLLIRRRVFKLEATEAGDGLNEILQIYCPRNEKEYQVQVVTPAVEEIDRIQQQLAEMLFGANEDID